MQKHPRDGPAVILLHGWPYDIHSYVEVAPLLAKAADGSAYARMGTGKHSHRILEGIGHNVPQEAPEAFARAVLDVDRH